MASEANAPTPSPSTGPTGPTGPWGAMPPPESHWGEFEDDDEEEPTSVFDLNEALSKEFVADLIDKSCSDEYTKGDPLEGLGDDELDTESYTIDGDVLYSLELKKHTSALKQLISLAQGRISAAASQVQQRLPEAPTAPQRPPTHLKHPTVHPLGFLPSRHTPFTLGQGTAPEELSVDSCLYILTKSISALAAHAGWDGAMSETLYVFRDTVDDFLRRLTTMLRVTVDQEAIEEGGGGFPDPVEQVFHTMGLGSVRDLHSYYQVQILGRIQHMESVCSQLTCEYEELAKSYNASLPSVSGWDSLVKQEIVSEIEEGEEEDDVPQLHFPSTSDGDLLQPSATLQTGFEMLHSLEQQQLLSEEESIRNEEFEEDRKVDIASALTASSSQPSKRARRM